MLKTSKVTKPQYLHKQALLICSLGRPDKCLKVLESFLKFDYEELDIYVLVEPHEHKLYQDAFNKTGTAVGDNPDFVVSLLMLPVSGYGVGFARWVGFQLLHKYYEYIICFDDDTKLVASSGGWKPLIEYMDKHPKCAWVGAWLAVYDLWAKGKDLDRFWPLGGQGNCMRSSALAAVNGWYNRLFVFEDCELALNFMVHGFDKGLCEKARIVTLGKRFQDGGLSTSVKKRSATYRKINDEAWDFVTSSYKPFNFFWRRGENNQVIVNFKKAERAHALSGIVVKRQGEYPVKQFKFYFSENWSFVNKVAKLHRERLLVTDSMIEQAVADSGLLVEKIVDKKSGNAKVWVYYENGTSIIFGHTNLAAFQYLQNLHKENMEIKKLKQNYDKLRKTAEKVIKLKSKTVAFRIPKKLAKQIL